HSRLWPNAVRKQRLAFWIVASWGQRRTRWSRVAQEGNERAGTDEMIGRTPNAQASRHTATALDQGFSVHEDAADHWLDTQLLALASNIKIPAHRFARQSNFLDVL